MYKTHPAAAVMPPLTDSEYAAMVTSIKLDGLLYPIKLIGDLIIDGSHRQKACIDAGVDPVYEQIKTDNPVRYVLSCDTRRHLTTKQRSAIAAELANMKLGSNPGKGHVQTEGSQNCPPLSNQDAADLMGVSIGSVKNAKKVMREDPEQHEAAKRGEKVKAKPKQKRVGWQKIAIEHGMITGTSGGSRVALKKKILAIDDSIRFTAGGLVPDMARKVERACVELKRREDPEGAKEEAESQAEAVSPYLSMTAERKLSAAIKAHKRILDAEFELRIQDRIAQELEVILPDYREVHQKHIDIINAHNGVLTHGEYKLVTGLLHSDKQTGIDDILRARFDRGFDIMQKKRDLLCGLKDSNKIENTLPSTLGELLKRRK